MEKNEVIQVKNLSKAYQLKGSDEPFWALKDISFSVMKGEILGIIGSNGAGKSTLLKILSDVIAPTSGEVIYSGRVSSILDIGTGFHPDLSGKDNIYLNASLLGLSKREIAEKLDEIIDFSGIGSFINEPVKNYSNGMYLRLAFSIAIHIDANILLLDEVVAVGDTEFRHKCYAKLRFLAGKGLTILIVTHNMSQILEFCSRCIRIDNGRLLGNGLPINVVEKYIESLSFSSIFSNEGYKKQVDLNYDIENFAVIEKVRLLDINNNDCIDIQVSDPFKINILCKKVSSESSLEVAIYLTNLDGIRIFLDSFAMRENYNYDKINAPGRYEIVCNIPSYLLNRGIYRVSLITSKGLKMQAQLEHIFTFKVLPSAEESGNEMIFNMLNTVVAPRFHWEINQIK